MFAHPPPCHVPRAENVVLSESSPESNNFNICLYRINTMNNWKQKNWNKAPKVCIDTPKSCQVACTSIPYLGDFDTPIVINNIYNYFSMKYPLNPTVSTKISPYLGKL
jgi:hypothetical protein